MRSSYSGSLLSTYEAKNVSILPSRSDSRQAISFAATGATTSSMIRRASASPKNEYPSRTSCNKLGSGLLKKYWWSPPFPTSHSKRRVQTYARTPSGARIRVSGSDGSYTPSRRNQTWSSRDESSRSAIICEVSGGTSRRNGVFKLTLSAAHHAHDLDLVAVPQRHRIKGGALDDLAVVLDGDHARIDAEP